AAVDAASYGFVQPYAAMRQRSAVDGPILVQRDGAPAVELGPHLHAAAGDFYLGVDRVNPDRRAVATGHCRARLRASGPAVCDAGSRFDAAVSLARRASLGAVYGAVAPLDRDLLLRRFLVDDHTSDT